MSSLAEWNLSYFTSKSVPFFFFGLEVPILNYFDNGVGQMYKNACPGVGNEKTPREETHGGSYDWVESYVAGHGL